ncbi:RagB/SusD family nutrient uptake outer membrane protein [Pedobacter africanus]|uniref:SusD family protein n=1 Tax=Pedobacter africanus TaxID=151894 RepID=A0A1W2A8H1_9SPHI|nr:RagB/SusD family nutrient uptake outer membrane protein [Pedobacter africanus]SMC56578.1 SusD family protein [Pedobacter africanus]
MKKIVCYIMLLLTTISQYACKKDLNALPPQAKVEGNVIIDQKSAEVAMNGAYSRLAVVGTSLSVNSTTYSIYHEVTPAMYAGWMQYGFGQVPDYINAVTPAASATLWTPNYAILNAANGVVEGVNALADSKFTGTRKAEMLAEARFLRAYAHFNLLAYYSEWYNINSAYGVMLRKESLQLSNAAQARSNVKDSYDFILQDIDFAIANAADTRPNYYANKTAAKVLKMRVLMLRGQSADYGSIITLANEVMANTNYQLEASLKDLMQVKGLTSKEIILGITPFTSQVGKRSRFEFIQSSVYLASPQFRKLLENDPRATWMLTKATTSTQASIRDSTYMSKFFGPKVEESYVFRLSEVYLLKAEAIVRSGGNLADARTLVHQVQEKAGITALANTVNYLAVENANTPALMLVEIYKEFSRNMVAEDGIEWLALLRLPFATVRQLRPTIIEQKQYILPIPLTEFQLNPTIGEQNPGYPRQ